VALGLLDAVLVRLVRLVVRRVVLRLGHLFRIPANNKARIREVDWRWRRTTHLVGSDRAGCRRVTEARAREQRMVWRRLGFLRVARRGGLCKGGRACAKWPCWPRCLPSFRSWDDGFARIAKQAWLRNPGLLGITIMGL
jgi:hypothetical protein